MPAVEKQKQAASRNDRATAQGGTRGPNYPKPRFPEQHQRAPGLESKLEPQPHYLAERYRAAGKLRGKAALITGADSGIGRAVALLYAREDPARSRSGRGQVPAPARRRYDPGLLR